MLFIEISNFEPGGKFPQSIGVVTLRSMFGEMGIIFRGGLLLNLRPAIFIFFRGVISTEKENRVLFLFDLGRIIFFIRF